MSRLPRAHLTTAHQQAAGRKRAEQFTKEFQSEAGRKGAAVRTEQADFYGHLCAIAPDGPAQQRAAMRAPKGSRLLKPEDVHFLRLEDIKGDLGAGLPEEKRRMLLGRYVRAYIYEGLFEPPRPTQEEFRALVERATARVGQGKPLLNPLHAIGVAANDFCNAVGRPYGWRNQRARFRQALREARRYASLLQEVNDYFCGLERVPRREPCEANPSASRGVGRRRPMHSGPAYMPAVRPPRLPIHWTPISWRHGRPDRVRVHDRHERCTSLPEAARAPGYWLPPGTLTGDEPDEEGEQTLPPVSTEGDPHDTA